MLIAPKSEKVKAMGVKFGIHVTRDSLDLTPYFVIKVGVAWITGPPKNSVGGDYAI